MKEEGYAEREEIFRNQLKVRAINIENGIIKRSRCGCVRGWADLASPKTKTTQGDNKRKKTWQELANRNIMDIEEMATLEIEGVVSGIRLAAKKEKRNAETTVYGKNTATPSFAKIKDLSMMMKNGKSLTMCPENHNRYI